MNRLKPVPSKRIAAALLLIGDIWLNLAVWNGWPTGSRGFPFAYETWCDAVPCLEFHWLALVGNVVVALIGLAILMRYWPVRNVSRFEAALLLAFLTTYVWANIQVWFGWRFTFWSSPLTREAGERLLLGFPFVYRTPYEELPVGLFANVVVGVACLVLIRVLFDNRTAHEPA